ncbi:transmembrane protein 154 isoform X2 [Phacochoerus africanus]|uniref:transmembrane protein 154 isoform X2 n=1 Tax=Phacochoerus africanus TaxID=41426 RepID=UPI001FD95235|nr:transmembrane protein 154 isoform X2 [Phacochoerus africanus]
MLLSADPQAPGATLVVALVIASLPTSQEQDDMEPPEHSAEIPPEMESLDEGTVTPSAFAAVTTETLPANISFPLIEEDGAQAEFMLMVLVPSILLALLLLSVVFLVIHRKRKRNKREPSSQGSHSALQTILGDGTPLCSERPPRRFTWSKKNRFPGWALASIWQSSRL